MPLPVFVDDSGSRRRRLRKVYFWIAATIVVVAALAWFAVAAIDVRPAPVVTCPAKGQSGQCDRR